MFKKIKMLLYDKGYVKPKTIFDKLDYLKWKGIEPYDTYISAVNIQSVASDITKYNIELAELLEQNYLEDYVVVKSITRDSYYDINIIGWFSDNGRYISNVNYEYNLWLDQCRNILKYYYAIKDNHSDYIAHGNSIKIQPYIINIERIVNILLETTLKR